MSEFIERKQLRGLVTFNRPLELVGRLCRSQAVGHRNGGGKTHGAFCRPTAFLGATAIRVLPSPAATSSIQPK